MLLFQIYFWAVGLRGLLQSLLWVPGIRPGSKRDSSEDYPLISVIVPAHNEQATIRECVRSVLDQDYPRYELILVDDRSEDLTASIAADLARDEANFKVITVRKLTEGWTGKSHALDVGGRHASGEWLAFLDADCSLDKSALRQCYQAAVKHKVSMVTLSPKFILKTFWEKALQPAFVVASSVVFPLPKINDPASPVASANGMFFLISRYAYDKIGGHHGVKGLAVEDIGIGKRVKASGLGLLFANGRYLLRTRMYEGFRATLDGWTRILSGSMNYEVGTVVRQLAIHVLMSPFAAVFCSIYVCPRCARTLSQHLVRIASDSCFGTTCDSSLDLLPVGHPQEILGFDVSGKLVPDMDLYGYDQKNLDEGRSPMEGNNIREPPLRAHSLGSGSHPTRM